MAKSWLQKYATYEEEIFASAVGVVAFAGGGQASATQLIKKFNSVDTVVTANDSVKLTPALIGKVQGVFNNSANDLIVYPSSGEYIDATINNGFTITASDYVEFRAYASGKWDSYAGGAGAGTGTVTSVSVVTANGFSGTVATANTTPAITIRTTVTGILVGNGTLISAAGAGDFPTLNQSTTGNAATATALQTARTINGVSFDGTANIVIPVGSGTVTTVSVVTANGFVGTVANDTTTPAITLTTSVTGVLKGNGTAISAATSGTDYSLGTSALATGILKSTTTTGALTIAVASDFPTLNQNTTGTASNVTGVVAIANGGTGQITATLGFNALSPLTTRGDLLTRDATNNIRLAKGATGKFLTTDANDVVWSTSTIPSSAGATANKLLLSDGTNYVLSTPTFPNASATSGKIIISDGTNWISSTPTFPNAATGTGTILRANGTNWAATTATYPDTVVANCILYATGTNVIGTNAKFIFNGTNLMIGASSLVLTEQVSIQSSVNGSNITLFKNASSGSLASSLLVMYNDANVGAVFGVRSSTYTPSGSAKASGADFAATGDGGLSLSAGHASGDIRLYTGGYTDSNERVRVLSTGKIGFGVTAPTAAIHIKAGTATANSGPFQINVGVSETTPRSGLMQFSSTSSSGIQAISGSRFTLTESDTTERYIVQAATSVKTTAGAPYANDGYVIGVINGTQVKIMTTA